MTVSVGFAAHVVDLLDWFGLHPSPTWISPAYLPEGLQDLAGNWLYHPGWHFGFNIPAFLIVLVLTVILVRGIRESASTNNMMVGLKLIAILIFIFAVIGFLHPANWHPFMPNGWSGVLTGGSIIFFTYIGFDSVSTAAEECQQPAARSAHRHHRDAGGVHGALCCGGHLPDRPGAVAVDGGRCRAGGERAQEALGPPRRASAALDQAGRPVWGHHGHAFVVLVYQLGQSRVWFSMSRDGLLPKVFSNVHPVFRTPAFSTWVAGFVVAIPSGPFDIGTLADLSNIGTLFAFVLV